MSDPTVPLGAIERSRVGMGQGNELREFVECLRRLIPERSTAQVFRTLGQAHRQAGCLGSRDLLTQKVLELLGTQA